MPPARRRASWRGRGRGSAPAGRRGRGSKAAPRPAPPRAAGSRRRAPGAARRSAEATEEEDTEENEEEESESEESSEEEEEEETTAKPKQKKKEKARTRGRGAGHGQEDEEGESESEESSEEEEEEEPAEKEKPKKKNAGARGRGGSREEQPTEAPRQLPPTGEGDGPPPHADRRLAEELKGLAERCGLPDGGAEALGPASPRPFPPDHPLLGERSREKAEPPEGLPRELRVDRREGSPTPLARRPGTAEFLRERLAEARRKCKPPGSARRALCLALGERALEQTAELLAQGESRDRRGRSRRRRHRRRSRERSRSRRRRGGEPEASSGERSESSTELGRDSQVMQLARRTPGALGLSLLVEMLRQLGDSTHGGVGQAAGEARGTAVAYLTRVLIPQLGSRLPLLAERELRTLAEAIDGVVAGQVQQVFDLLAQRFRAVETSCTEEGGWSLARHLEVLHSARKTTVPAAMRSSMAHEQRNDQRLRRQLRGEHDYARERGDRFPLREEGKGSGGAPWRLPSAVGGKTGPGPKGQEKGGGKQHKGKK